MPGLKPETHTAVGWGASALANVPPPLPVPCVSEE